MSYLLTGGGGFIGQSLLRHLRAHKKNVFWTSRNKNVEDSNHFHLNIHDHKSVEEVFTQLKPEVVIHLAAVSSVKDSFADWENTIRTNFEGSFSIFEAVRKYCPKTFVISTGSSAEYGAQAQTHEFLREDLKPLPSSPYGLSKSSQAALVEFYHRVHKLNIVHIRPFAVIGPQKRGDFIADFITQALQIKYKKKSEIQLGDIERQRDFIDVEDFCGVIELLEKHAKPGEIYNISNGKSNSFRDVIELTSKILNIPIKVTTDQQRMRLSDDRRLVADISKLNSLGYQQKISLEESLKKIIASIETECFPKGN